MKALVKHALQANTRHNQACPYALTANMVSLQQIQAPLLVLSALSATKHQKKRPQNVSLANQVILPSLPGPRTAWSAHQVKSPPRLLPLCVRPALWANLHRPSEPLHVWTAQRAPLPVRSVQAARPSVLFRSVKISLRKLLPELHLS